MINLGVKGRAFVLAFIPMLFITVLLSIYFIHHLLSDIDIQINSRGESMAIDLANASEYGLFSGNIDSLRTLLKSSTSQNDILSIKILDKDGYIVLDLSSNSYRNMTAAEITRAPTKTFLHSIILHTTPVSDIRDEESTISAREKPEILGWVAVEISTRNLNEEQKHIIKNSVLIILAGLIGSILLSLWISRSLTIPITRITTAVRDIEKGKLDVDINTTSSGEIGSLETGVKSMLGRIKLTQQDLQNKVEDATAGLNNSLKLLERQNIELTEARQDALQASQAKSRFLANISHEIRTPMNGILGFVHLLLNSPLSKEQKEYLNTIEKSADNLLTLIEDILDLSRAEAGKLPLRHTFFNLQECVEEVMTLMMPSVQAKNLEIAAIHYSDTPFYIHAPYERIRQILINLVGNAIKFSDAGTIVIRTMLDHESTDPNFIRISVSDQGIGIPADVQNQLFTPFSQLDDSSTRTHGGSGLGLAISKSLANAMGGDIGLNNDSDIGSTFWFTFNYQPERQQNSIQTTRHISDQLNVCLYDSNKFTNASISSCFKHIGLNVISHLDLNEFVTDTKDNKNYDIYALSLNQNETADKDIHSAISHLKESTKAKVLVFVYNMDTATKTLMLNQSADACLTRPCIQNNLLNTLSGLLNPEGTNMVVAGKINPATEITDSTHKATLEGLKILVAEDNPINTKLLLTVLKDSGAECLHASNGEEAINIYRENDINLVLMDKQMPLISGLDATRKIRQLVENKSPVPIIGLTAATTPEELSEFMISGIDDILTKPIATDELIHEILYWVNHYNNLKKVTPDQNTPPNKDVTSENHKGEKNSDSLGINEELSSTLRSMLIEELPATASKLQEAYARNDWATMREQLHKLLGGLSYCNLPELYKKTKSLRTSIKHQSDSLNNDYEDLLAEIDKIMSANAKTKKPGI